jgi:DNA helicase-4
MISGNELLSAVDGHQRQLVVGDEIRHPVHGSGSLESGWEGHLEVLFPSGHITLTDLDGLCLIPSDLKGAWLLLTTSEAKDWIDNFNHQRRLALAEMKSAFEQDFLGADELFIERLSRYLTREEFEQEKVFFVQSWVKKSVPAINEAEPRIPDDEQATAMASHGTHIQVVARAGSGKTETVANRAAFLLRHCKVRQGEMLLLAFNKKAAIEMAERVQAKLGTDSIPHIMTFHALAYAIVPGAKQLLVNQSDDGEQSLNQEFQQVLMDSLENHEFESRVRRLMLAHFRADWDRILTGGFDLSRDEMLAYRRSLASETLRGEYVKSFGEKVIANLLFEHDVRYLYEQNHWWKGRNYRPDFTLPKTGRMSKGVVIEYFGLIGDPDYDEEAEAKRGYWESKSDEWNFIELNRKHFAGGQSGFESVLGSLLAKANVPLTRLSEDEIWERARTRSILRFTEAASGFVGRCRKMWLTPEDLAKKVSAHDSLVDIEAWFIEIATELYVSYLDRLKAIGSDDFDGLMQQSITNVLNGKCEFSRKDERGDLSRIRYLFVDEYQDFTELFHRMVDAIRQINPQIEVFCVGDDWQAINRYAGSDLTYYQKFDSIFSPSVRLGITTNRRSSKSVVEAGNALMVNRGQPACIGKDVEGSAVIVDLAKFKPTSLEDSLFNKALLTPVVLRIAGKALDTGKSVVLLSVRNKLIEPGGRAFSLDWYLSALRSKLPPTLRDRLSISTAHGYKGKESDVVIILDAMERSYPLIHPNWVFARVLGESIEAIVDESRRLFYVALTRARESVFVITESGRESPFIQEIRSCPTLGQIQWNNYPPMTGSEWITVKISGAYDSISPLISGLKADGYRYRDLTKSGGNRSWDRSYRVSTLDPRFLDDSPWMVIAKTNEICNGVVADIHNGTDQRIARFQLMSGQLQSDDQGSFQAFDWALFISKSVAPTEQLLSVSED